MIGETPFSAPTKRRRKKPLTPDEIKWIRSGTATLQPPPELDPLLHFILVLYRIERELGIDLEGSQDEACSYSDSQL